MEASENVVLGASTYSGGTAVAEVEVDADTGGVTIRNYVLVHDCGRIINPMTVDGQAIGGTAHGIGNALFEWMMYDENGQPLTTNLSDYMLVTATEMPPIDLIHHESPTYLNPLGVKGVGECGVVPAAPAIVSAIEDALSPFGVQITRVPIFPPQILELIQNGRAAA